MKLKLSEERIVQPWKTRIISLMQTKFTEGLTFADVLTVYPAAPQKYVELAMKDILRENLAEEIKED